MTTHGQPALASDPWITIGITAYREGDWLAECWASVLSQSDDRWDAVLVLDGGADQRTREVFNSLDHPKLRKFEMPSNVGPYPTRNRAFELTKAPYHFYLDGDDQLAHDSVEKALQTFARNPDAAFVYGDYACFGLINEVWQFPATVSAAAVIEGQPVPCGCVYKTSTWKALGGFATELARGNADYDFFIGALENGFVGCHCGGIFYRYRRSDALTVSRTYGRRYHETHETMVRRHPVFFDDRRRRNRFLALGYRRAAVANAAAGDAKLAVRLAWKAIRHGLWRDQGLQIIILEGARPQWAYASMRSAIRFARHLVARQ